MGENNKINEIKQLLLSVYADIRFLVGDAGFGLEQGIILYFSNEKVKENVIRMLCEFNGVIGEIHGTRIPKCANYQMLIVEYQPFYSQEGIYRFMTSKNFLPVMVVCGIIPPELNRYTGIVSYEDLEIERNSIGNMLEMFRTCMEYIRQNGNDIVGCMKEARSLYDSEDEDASLLGATLFSVAWALNHALIHTEDELISLDELKKAVKSMSMVSLMTDLEIIKPVQRSLNSYIDEHPSDIVISAIDRIDQSLYDAVDKKKAILFDDKFYYIPDALFHKAINSLCNNISYPRIKGELQRRGTLCCNATKNNYSVKKHIFTEFGELRARFLIFSREHLDTLDCLTIEERGRLSCTSVALMKE
ncbi:MAG: hypothetical protein IJZ55_08940 [Lachnospiraceae bacterium]|nr:hypothetical protein [Lachnospiraceae bacterium]